MYEMTIHTPHIPLDFWPTTLLQGSFNFVLRRWFVEPDGMRNLLAPFP